MNDEKIPSDLGNLFQISHSREVSSWPLAVCSQCGLGGEVWGLFCIWLKLTWVDFWRIIIDAIDVIQGGDRAGQLCLRLRLQSKATNPTFGGRIWMLLQTTQTHYISGESNVLRKKYFEVDTLNEFPSLSADRTSGLCAWSRTEGVSRTQQEPLLTSNLIAKLLIFSSSLIRSHRDWYKIILGDWFWLRKNTKRKS